MTAAAIDLLRPEWPAPAGIGALCSLRGGGVSGGAWASLNLGDAVGDAPAAVAENRRRLQAATAQDDADQPPAQPVYLRQVHGARVVRIGKADLQRQSADEPPHEADAEVFGPVLMALSHDWQAHGRAHAARVREHWLRQADAAEAAAALEHGTEPAASSAAVAAAAVGDAIPAHGVAPGTAAVDE